MNKLLIFLSLILTSCSTYYYSAQPVPNPQSYTSAYYEEEIDEIYYPPITMNNWNVYSSGWNNYLYNTYYISNSSFWYFNSPINYTWNLRPIWWNNWNYGWNYNYGFYNWNHYGFYNWNYGWNNGWNGCNWNPYNNYWSNQHYNIWNNNYYITNNYFGKGKVLNSPKYTTPVGKTIESPKITNINTDRKITPTYQKPQITDRSNQRVYQSPKDNSPKRVYQRQDYQPPRTQTAPRPSLPKTSPQYTPRSVPYRSVQPKTSPQSPSRSVQPRSPVRK